MVRKKMFNSNSYEEIYLWTLLLFRMSTSLFMNTPAIIMYITNTLGTMGFIFFIAIILNSKREVNFIDHKKNTLF